MIAARPRSCARSVTSLFTLSGLALDLLKADARESQVRVESTRWRSPPLRTPPGQEPSPVVPNCPPLSYGMDAPTLNGIIVPKWMCRATT